eukprot:XP_001696034.1 predicted protein [Chlamydomonas reinhardtii]
MHPCPVVRSRRCNKPTVQPSMFRTVRLRHVSLTAAGQAPAVPLRPHSLSPTVQVLPMPEPPPSPRKRATTPANTSGASATGEGAEECGLPCYLVARRVPTPKMHGL